MNTELANQRGLWKTLFLLVAGILSPAVIFYVFAGIVAWVETFLRRDR